MKLKAAMLGAVLWPAFVGAALGDAILFTLIDPAGLEWFGSHENMSREGAYTVGFFLLWFLIAGASFVSLWLHDGAAKKRDLSELPLRDSARQ
ncbi:MAG: hypothetical protein ABIZ64_02630 [Casimicrobium sp.]|jgi:hypothetical protein